MRVRKNGRVGRGGEGWVCRKEVGMCFLILIAGGLVWVLLVLWEIPSFFFLFSFFRTDVDVGVDGGNDGVGRFMIDFSRYDG